MRSDRPLLVALRPLGLGDLLTAIPALRALARAFPHYRRVLAAPPALAEMVPLVRSVEALVPTMPLRALPSDLNNADIAVDLHGRGPASQGVLLASRPRRLIAFTNQEVDETLGFPAWRADEHEVARWCRLLSESGVPADPSELDLDLDVDPGARTPTTVIHPGAAFPARQWPPERWAEVARHEIGAGRQVVITGGVSERTLTSDVARRAGLDENAVLGGRTGLEELARLVAGAERVVCGDTGVAHLATATRTPSVVLFGPVSPALWGPPVDRPWNRPIWAGRSGDPHGQRPDPGLLQIGVDDVVRELGQLDSVLA